MQRQSKSKLYKKLCIVSAACFGLGLLLVFIGLSSLYGAVNKCGFDTGTCSYSNAHGIIAKVGGVVTAIGFYAGIVFIILFLIARSKEKRSSGHER